MCHLKRVHHQVIPDKVGTKSSHIQKESVNDKSEPNTHKEALHANPSENRTFPFGCQP